MAERKRPESGAPLTYGDEVPVEEWIADEPAELGEVPRYVDAAEFERQKAGDEIKKDVERRG